MERIKVSENFFLDEFVDPHTYFNETDNGLSLIDNDLFKIAQHLRTLYGAPIGINNWWHYFKENQENLSCVDIIKEIESHTFLWWNGARRKVYKWSGIRTERCPIGAAQSAHKLYKAIDPKGPAKELNQLVEDNPKSFYDIGVRRLEDYRITPGWLHLDTLERNTQPNSIRVVDLTSHVKTIKW